MGNAKTFRNRPSAYASDIAGENRKALHALRTDAAYRDRYARFLGDMVYGERAEFDEAFATVIGLAENAWRS